MEKLFLIPQQGAVFLTLLGVGIGLGAWWQLLSWVRRRMPGLGALWDGLFAVSLGAALLGVLLRPPRRRRLLLRRCLCRCCGCWAR